ncbi:sugar phosphate isomerase/epimerase family protein [Salinicola sp. MH3R3-1]|uniref:sugar phosphate isomerase/epimerase family protein n=1 Tax=Salinicola sp. MH3R3-1 TaxID=1928762 RepID=UPI000ACB0BBD|nr:sugar phosphate isomerase/epimerase family protein [Salinicola sp. MH3R3-1]
MKPVTKTSMATLCLSGEMMNKLEAIARAGFEGVEIFVDDLQSSGLSPRAVGDRCRELGLTVVALQPFRDAEALPSDLHRKMLDDANRQFDTLADLGGSFLLACSTTREDASNDPSRAAETLNDLAMLAAEREMRVGYEALAWGRHVFDYRDAWQIVQQADHPALSLVLDSYHILARELELETLATIPGDRIGLVQLADSPLPRGQDLQSLSRHRRAFPGDGELPLERFLTALDQTGYQGPLSLEIFSDALAVMPTGMAALQGKHALESLRTSKK